MARYLLHHRHESAECGVVFASFKGHHSPLRHQTTLASCRTGGHEIWWTVEADSEADALRLLPFYVAERTSITRVGEVQIHEQRRTATEEQPPEQGQAGALPHHRACPSYHGKRRGVRTMDRYRGLLERYVELYNAGDLDGVMDLYAEDAVQLMPDGTFEGRSAIRDRLAKELAAFADIAHRYVSYIEQGDAFADEWVFVGTHTGPLELPDGTELAATGRRVEMPGMEFVKVRDGKIVVDNLYYDNLAIAAQFGLLPQPATTP